MSTLNLEIEFDEQWYTLADVIKHLPAQHDQKRHGRPGEGLSEGYGGGGENISPGRALREGHHIKRFTVGEEEVKKVLRNGEVRISKRSIYKFVDSLSGQEVTDEAEIARLRKLAPPNAFNVMLNPDPNGHILSLWTDSKGRAKGGKYNKAHDVASSQSKFERAKAFNDAMPKIKRRIIRDLESGDSKEREAASILYLVYKTAFRIGGAADTKAEVQAYGASTLLGKHVNVNGNKITFDFIGKKGVRIHKSLSDAMLAKIISDRKTEQWSNPLFSVGGGAVNQYLKSISNDDFSVKDFRNWHATSIALNFISKKVGPAPDEKRFKIWQKEVATKVAKFLGNTASVSLNEYINPNVWDAWRKTEWGAWVPKKLKEDKSATEDFAD